MVPRLLNWRILLKWVQSRLNCCYCSKSPICPFDFILLFTFYTGLIGSVVDTRQFAATILLSPFFCTVCIWLGLVFVPGQWLHKWSYCLRQETMFSLASACVRACPSVRPRACVSQRVCGQQNSRSRCHDTNEIRHAHSLGATDESLPQSYHIGLS